MELIFAYGSPNAMWRDKKNETYIFLYEGHSENSLPQKKEFKSPVENTNSNSQQQSMLGQQKEYIAFTIKQSNIEAVDIIDLDCRKLKCMILKLVHLRLMILYCVGSS